MHPTILAGSTTPFPSAGYVRPNPSKRTQRAKPGPKNREREGIRHALRVKQIRGAS